MQTPNTAHFSNIWTIIRAAQGLLDVFTGLSITDMLALPPHIYAGRVIYAVILLMKLHKGVSARVCKLSEDISVGQLRLEEYIERLLLISKGLTAEDSCSSLSRAFLIMSQLKNWLRSDTPKSIFENNERSVGKGSHAKIRASPVPGISNQAQLQRGLAIGSDTQVYATAGYASPLGALKSQSNNMLSQSGIPENTGDMSSREIASDSWFWEFFNVDMFN
ncbi:hypothetical protein N7481_010289 [Penicillium waksmanii]|uniref:uncharacterized protein n=1 Tax=Penicillium waksmanii TaxID=69791 RepID=UPI002547BC73|nr:uncharacterized protein N7481_010289 [Penicillium waksmanii]KAJ5976582.1 hypothetical protein N7481_010289 [Penicillium waksmanii]